MKTNRYIGDFDIEGQACTGHLVLDGPKTLLTFYSDSEFLLHTAAVVKGVTKEHTKLSLLQCVSYGSTFKTTKDGNRSSVGTAFPHFVLVGEAFLEPTDARIKEIHFTCQDAHVIFNDFYSFGMVVDGKPYIKELLAASGVNYSRLPGPYPSVFYFAGQNEILTVPTAFGDLLVWHNKRSTFPSVSGISVKNRVSLMLTPIVPVSFSEAMYRVSTILKFLGTVSGRPQKQRNLEFVVVSEDGSSHSLKCYSSMSEKRGCSEETHRAHPSDLLLDSVMCKDEFCEVAKNWIARHEEWKEARFRFAGSFAEQR